MSNFKPGSGDLDFGEDDKSDTAISRGETSGKPDEESNRSPPGRCDENDSTPEKPPKEEYPYFIRRNNVGDERETRLEVHLRERVADQEATFRNELAEELGANEVSKTDAREFALLAAFHNPEKVAELMEDEGFGALD